MSRSVEDETIHREYIWDVLSNEDYIGVFSKWRRRRSQYQMIGISLPWDGKYLRKRKTVDEDSSDAKFLMESLSELFRFRFHATTGKASTCILIQPSPLPLLRLTFSFSSRPHYPRFNMDFSQFNAAEQAHMTKVIEKKQV